MATRDGFDTTTADLRKFEKGLETGAARQIMMWDMPFHVRSLGHVSPEQFKEQFNPSQHAADWDQVEQSPSFAESVDYSIDNLTKSVEKHGVQKPVVVSRIAKQRWPWDESVKQVVLDGHHRALAAMRAGKPIPTYVLDKRHDPRS